MILYCFKQFPKWLDMRFKTQLDLPYQLFLVFSEVEALLPEISFHTVNH